MTLPKPPPHEAFRLATLNDYEVLDTPDEQQFDRIVRLACLVMRTPLSVISLVDRDRQWFKAAQGLGTRETSRAVSFCAHGLDLYRPLIVTDARADARFADNPFVIGGKLRGYVGAPLVAPNGMCLGMLCVATPETMPSPSDAQLSAMGDLGDMVMRELEQHRLAAVWREGPATATRGPLLRLEILDVLEAVARQRPGRLRDLSARPDCGPAPRPQPVDAIAAIDDALRRLADVAARRGLRPRRIGQAANWAVIGEAEALGDTLVQFGLNAIAACPAQGTITVSVMHSSLGMTDVNMFNTGRALDAADCARALTPLGQPSAAGGTGTGIGLPIARVAIERLGGGIGLRGAPEIGGTIATVTLPTAPTTTRMKPVSARRPGLRAGAAVGDCRPLARPATTPRPSGRWDSEACCGRTGRGSLSSTSRAPANRCADHGITTDSSDSRCSWMDTDSCNTVSFG